MTVITLPPLPMTLNPTSTDIVEYGLKCRDEAFEEAARMFERKATLRFLDKREVAEAIRSLKDEK